MMKKFIFPIIFIIVFVLLDQISKYFFFDMGFWSNLFFVQPAFNTGISRSLPVNVILVIVLTIVISVLILIGYKRNYIGKRAMIFLIGGTLGNLVDRICFFGVRDFIMMVSRFPVFNLADIFICVGAFLVIIKEVFLFNGKNLEKVK